MDKPSSPELSKCFLVGLPDFDILDDQGEISHNHLRRTLNLQKSGLEHRLKTPAEFVKRARISLPSPSFDNGKSLFLDYYAIPVIRSSILAAHYKFLSRPISPGRSLCPSYEIAVLQRIDPKFPLHMASPQASKPIPDVFEGMPGEFPIVWNAMCELETRLNDEMQQFDQLDTTRKAHVASALFALQLPNLSLRHTEVIDLLVKYPQLRPFYSIILNHPQNA